MNPGDMGIVLDLIDYVYTHTERHELEEESSLRNLVFQYISCQIDKLTVDDRFEQLVSRNGNLAGDIVREALRL